MTRYFDALASDVNKASLDNRETDRFLEALGEIEEPVKQTVLLNSGDREFPDEFREAVMGSIVTYMVSPRRDSFLPEGFCDNARRLAATLRHSTLLSDLHRIFHELSSRRIQTRFGYWTDDPEANLKARDAYDRSKS